jgi:SAM-dependent methyltransferase
MDGIDEIRTQVMRQAAGAMGLQVAFVGVANGLFTKLHELGEAAADRLADAAGRDRGYVERWCDAAFAFGYLEETEAGFGLSALGSMFRPEAPGTLMPFAVNSVLFAHVAERAAGLCVSGERPGESVLTERASIAPWFGSMLEAMLGTLFEEQILPAVPAFARANEVGGLIVDLGCGNGWYLRRLLRQFSRLRGKGVDGFAVNVEQAVQLAKQQQLAHRLDFVHGEILDVEFEEPAQLIAMNRALHHVWDRRQRVFELLRDGLAPGGAVVIWEPRWPDARAELRRPRRPGMAAQNLSEHVQGNHFLRPAEIQAELARIGLVSEVWSIADGAEVVVVGSKQ